MNIRLLIALILPAHYKILFHLAHYIAILQELELQNKDFFLNSISPQVLSIDLTSIQISGDIDKDTSSWILSNLASEHHTTSATLKLSVVLIEHSDITSPLLSKDPHTLGGRYIKKIFDTAIAILTRQK
ncbi:hypothetical protein [Phormidium tenue]|uniref:Uncharacterized protein n=1 Tax=Phormidium tenue FACHB-1050 TaxID=2692857 RepID=A0ABR8CE28_9CYAN|nr:hypothetical protein [Phormidium tenue]MBD2317774.1 hypothetical protein [Phormidium tenue FACHB-1050]